MIIVNMNDTWRLKQLWLYEQTNLNVKQAHDYMIDKVIIVFVIKKVIIVLQNLW